MKAVRALLFGSLLLPVPASRAQAPAAPAAQAPGSEQEELNQSLAEAGGSQVDFIRALENHLRKYPNTAQRASIERALVKAAIETKDDARIILYGERVLASEPGDLQIMDKVTRSLLVTDDKANARKALGYSNKYLSAVDDVRKKPAPGGYSEIRWQDELDKGAARALLLQSRATGNLGDTAAATAIARRSWAAYPTGGAAREIARWLSRSGNNKEAVEVLANAFTIEDPASTEQDRARDRMRMGELYQKLNGSEKGLGDLILQAYDRTSALMGDRVSRLKAADPNVSASKIMDFTLPGANGPTLALSSLRGKTVVFDFWATWCGPCRAQHPLYEKVQERFKDNPAVVFLAVATDEDRELVAPFLKQHKWTNKVFYEAGLARTLEISSIPTTIIVDRSGNIASRMNGFVPERFVELLTERINQTLKN